MNTRHAHALDADGSIRVLQRRDRAVLFVHATAGLLIVIVGELAAFHLDLANRVGMGPVVFRGVVYVGLTTALWSILLRGNRNRVGSLLDELRQGYESILVAHDRALSLKDAYTGGHGRRVSACAARIAAAMGLMPAQVNDVREAALLHDLGKIGVPDAILAKPAPLNPDEAASIRKHPESGAAILEAIPALKRHVPAVRHHHERYDGTGYPDGLRGGSIPLAARIIAVADVWDALTTERSYRHALHAREAIAQMSSLAGTQFDPAVVAALRKVVVPGAPAGNGSAAPASALSARNDA